VDYVYKVLTENTDLSVSIQYFSFSYTFEPTPSTLTLNSGGKSTPVASGTEWLSAANQGAGNVTGGFSFVPNLGCNATDYDNTTIAGKITVIQRGTCTFTSKAVFSESAGAIGVLVVNTEGEPIPYVGLGQTVSLPVFVISYDLGFSIQLLSQTDPSVTATMTSSSETLTVYTSNVIADTLTGNPNSTIVVGSHLDSVTAGPGINDNGSGSSANLEMALNINKVTLSNRVRFAWWGAEELGLRGSEAYVASLSPAQLAEVALNLNFGRLPSFLPSFP
jgi:Zn-dependent M28 family amino/carboxypeptidase